MNRKHKFTPGPWRISKKSDAVIADSTESLCIPGSFGDDAKEYYGGNLIGESIAPGNRNLIRLAPEMFSLLNTISANDPVWEEIITLLLSRVDM